MAPGLFARIRALAWRMSGARVGLALTLLCLHPGPAAHASTPVESLHAAAALRLAGRIQPAIDLLNAALGDTPTIAPPEAAALQTELGLAYLQSGRPGQAKDSLQQAYAASSGAARATAALYLAQLASARQEKGTAANLLSEARVLAPTDVGFQLAVGLAQTSLAARAEQPALLKTLAQALTQWPASGTHASRRSALALHLGDQARQLGAHRLAHEQLLLARQIAEAEAVRKTKPLLAIEAVDAMAQLYEDQGRSVESLALSASGLRRLRQLPAGDAASGAALSLALQWRQARLLARRGAQTQALDAYETLLAHTEAMRQDIPVVYADGRSSFTSTLEPLYQGYAGLLLQGLDGLPADAVQARLRQVRDLIELLRQTELQDFMGERCAVEAVGGGSVGRQAAGTAVLYPLILKDHLELLLETSTGLMRRRVAIDSARLRQTATDLAERLRNERADFLPGAQALYQWLIAPLRAELDAQAIQTLVFVPEGTLRLVPPAVLHDGKAYLVEQFALGMVSGLSMTNTARPAAGRAQALVAGLSLPGPVVGELGDRFSLLPPGFLLPGADVNNTVFTVASRSATGGRTPGNTRSSRRARLVDARDLSALREQLALPGVEAEVKALGAILPGSLLLNGDFTLANFMAQAGAGNYQMIHLASHGVFGGTAESSFIMAYDRLLGMDSLQTLLQSERYRLSPVELLSLSACETAEGNDRAPLGMAGAAIRARAKSVLGTLWPVDDQSARLAMEALYQGLRNPLQTKAQALRQAQLAQLRATATTHPFYWAPFVLIGNWQ